MALFLIILALLFIIFFIFALKTGLFPYLKHQIAEGKRRAALKSRNLHIDGTIKAIDIDLFNDNVKFSKGEAFRITTNQPGMTATLDENGVLKLTSSNEEELPINVRTEIVLSKEEEDDRVFDFVKVHLKKGDILLDDISANDFDLYTGEGNIGMRKSSTKEKTNILVDHGHIEIESGIYNNMDIYSKNGTITTSCQALGDNKFLVDMGSMTVRMQRPLKMYKIHIEAESGFVGFEGRRGTKFKTEGKPYTLDCYIKIGNATLTYSEDNLLNIN